MTKTLKIAFQGEPGANSHIAITEAYPDAEALPCPTFEDALAAIASGEADLGMIPIENSVAGRVADIHHLLPASGLFIIGEWFLPVRHQLMAPKGTKLAEIKTVESHVHALGQCRRIIRQLGIKPVVAADTAGSARIVAQRGDPSTAAIASRLAAQIYGLDILAEDVEDEAHNTTRFVVLAREAKWAAQGSGPLVTTFVFRVRNLPAALYKALGGFATNSVNMTKLESYMVDGNFFATQFYADVDGHPDDKGLAFALEELKFFSREFRIVGVYPGHPFRATFSETMERAADNGANCHLPHHAGRDQNNQAALLAASPNASASRLYDFFRASWSNTAVITINSSAWQAVSMGCSFAMTVAGLPTKKRERLRAIEARSASV